MFLVVCTWHKNYRGILLNAVCVFLKSHSISSMFPRTLLDPQLSSHFSTSFPTSAPDSSITPSLLCPSMSPSTAPPQGMLCFGRLSEQSPLTWNEHESPEEQHVKNSVLRNGAVHHSHETWLLNAILFCGRCGAWCTSAPRLDPPCTARIWTHVPKRRSFRCTQPACTKGSWLPFSSRSLRCAHDDVAAVTENCDKEAVFRRGDGDMARDVDRDMLSCWFRSMHLDWHELQHVEHRG